MKNGKYKIKRYKVKRGKGLLWILFALAAAAAALFMLNGRHILTLPAFTAPALSAEEMQQQTRVITLPGGQWFALQLGAFEEEKSARTLADSFRSRGAAGHVYPGDTYRVLAAAYESRESAQAVQAQLALHHGVDAYLYPLARSEVTLRLTGQKAQLDALEDAFLLCDQLTYTLASLSQALDKGEMTFQCRPFPPSEIRCKPSITGFPPALPGMNMQPFCGFAPSFRKRIVCLHRLFRHPALSGWAATSKLASFF